MMQQKFFTTKQGTIAYWTNEILPNRKTLVFLPGLTADHRLFERQTDYFSASYNVFVWDAAAHGCSRPFELDFSLADQARWLRQILQTEKIAKPVLVGQSMGGYVAQSFAEQFPDEIGGFIAIDSAPLQRKFYAAWELWSLKHTEPFYRLYPWKILLRSGAKGCATTTYGQKLMREMMENYTKNEFCRLSGRGFRSIAEAVEADLPYKISCPALLICGENDRAGFTKKYNKSWSETENLPIFWVKNAGHNANTDLPEVVNEQIERFLKTFM